MPCSRKFASIVIAFILGATVPACNLGEDLTLEVYDLQVVPAQAQAGDIVSFTFTLIVITSGSVNLTALIDDDAFRTQQIPGYHSSEFQWVLGDAQELIDQYGLGEHTARVSVVDGGTGRAVNSSVVTFELVAPAVQ
jgi:hypothetical protein